MILSCEKILSVDLFKFLYCHVAKIPSFQNNPRDSLKKKFHRDRKILLCAEIISETTLKNKIFQELINF